MIRIGVFFGGRSVEHEISIISAMQAIAAFDKTKYHIVPIYITKDSLFYTSHKMSEISAFKDIPALLRSSTEVTLARKGAYVELQAHSLLGKKAIDKIELAFPIVHGTFSEDGTLSGLFELLSLPYPSSDVLSSGICMNKYVTKTVLKDNEIPVLEYVLVNSRDFYESQSSTFEKVSTQIGMPCIIKPVNLGSSVGIGIAHDSDQFVGAMQTAFSFSQTVLVERAIINLKEINCSVLGDSSECIASVCEQPFNSDEILSYSDKYLNGGKSKGMASVKRQIPADIPSQLSNRICELAKSAFVALGCCGVVRIDFILDGDEIYVNEVNSIPGSLAFYLWEASGIKYDELLERMVSIALKRERERSRLNYSFDTNILQNVNFGGNKGKC